MIKMNFAARTSAKGVQDNLMSRVYMKKRGSFGPKTVGQKGLWFIDDLNLPSLDAYGFQPPLELLRQYVEFNGWYEMESLKMIQIVDFTLVAAIAPPGGSRSIIPPRLLRHFLVYSAAENNSQTLIRIFSKITKWICLRKGLGEEANRVLGFAVEGSIELFQQVTEVLKPTPAKPHYLYNLRDISKVFQGINKIDSREFLKGSNKICRMWLHETCRVMADRLTFQRDRETLHSKIKYVLNAKLRANLDNVMAEIQDKSMKQDDRPADMEKIIFTDLLSEGIDIADRPYVEQPSLQLVRKKVELELEEHNMSKKETMNISIFDFAVIQILKICRILKFAKSHGVLLGLGGSGRQTLTKLSAYIMGQQMVTLEVHKKYSQDRWRQDVKKILSDACLTSKASTLVITESQSNNMFLMQDIDSMLNLGEIPNLYDQEEFVKFLDKLKDKAKKDGEDKLVATGTIQE